jgi:hypothetical protein
MTITQPRYPFTRWIDAPLAAIRYLNEEPAGAGGAMARSNRFPQPSPSAGLAQAKQAHPAGKELAGV